MQKRELFLWIVIVFLLANIIFLYYALINVSGEIGLRLDSSTNANRESHMRLERNINSCSTDEDCQQLFALKGYSCQEEDTFIQSSDKSGLVVVEACRQNFCECMIQDADGKRMYGGTGSIFMANGLAENLLEWKLYSK